MLPGCGSTSPSTTPTNVVVSVQPGSASLFLGQTQQFQATVTGATDTSVRWLVNNVAGGNASAGTISAGGLYSAPVDLPSPASVTVVAVSNADLQSSASASVSLMDDIVVSVSPGNVSLPNGGAQVFMAGVTGTGNPNTSVTWSVNGVASGNAIVGTIAANGASTAVYTAPATPPSPATVSVRATSVADATKFGNASATISCATANSIAPSAASLALGQTQSFTATLCLAAGATITWDVNGTVGGSATLGTIMTTSVNLALYTAPEDLPAPNSLTIHATGTLATGGTGTVSAIVTVMSNVSLSVSPGSATVSVGQRKSFAANVTSTTDTAVSWTVNGVSNGNTIVGQICVFGSNPCVAPAGPASGSVDFLAPAAVPAANPVTLVATSRADASKSGNAIVAISGPVGPLSVEISPPYAFVTPSTGTLSTRQFFASITGTSNQSVTWGVRSGVTGLGCQGTACGSVDANGLYTAPTAAPSPNAISIVATSQADPTKSATGTIAVTSGPLIDVILPSSVLAGTVISFPLTVQGMNFSAGSGSNASVILLNGTARGTSCPAATSCSTALNPTDVQTAGTLTVQVQNPGAPGALSNPVPFVIAPFVVTEDVIALSASQPAATGKDLVVVEPTTAAVSAAIDVDFIGLLTGGNNCGVQGSPLSVTRPVSGTATASICVHGNGLDPTFTYAFSGPGDGDIGIAASSVTGVFPNTIELDLQIASTTLPGVRTLFITTLNHDRAAATGMLEVK
ncbi:MAG TPA: hypothetical protein VEX69_08635 [Candidatus Limnocylindria bacterium]|nr:hypothetical protein [Candidatus Limnocylindria bacterium]